MWSCLTTKSQDSLAAAARTRGLRAARAPPIVCLQNGVENERVALRRFENVYGAVVMVPAAHLEPGDRAAPTARRGRA